MTKDETQKEEHGDRAQIQGQVRERERARDMTDRRGHQVENKDQTKGAGTETDNT